MRVGIAACCCLPARQVLSSSPVESSHVESRRVTSSQLKSSCSGCSVVVVVVVVLQCWSRRQTDRRSVAQKVSPKTAPQQQLHACVRVCVCVCVCACVRRRTNDSASVEDTTAYETTCGRSALPKRANVVCIIACRCRRRCRCRTVSWLAVWCCVRPRARITKYKRTMERKERMTLATDCVCSPTDSDAANDGAEPPNRRTTAVRSFVRACVRVCVRRSNEDERTKAFERR